MDFARFGLAALQLMVIVMFVTAGVEVIKAVASVSPWEIIKELFSAVFKKTKLSEGTLKTLNFVLALVLLRSFEYAALARLLGIETIKFGAVAYWMDYIFTASVVFMGADYIFSWYWKLKSKAEEVGGVKKDPVG